MMNMNAEAGSARIYQFPVRGRFATSPMRDGKPDLDQIVASLPKVVCGGSWYHEEAVQQTDRQAKR